MVRFDYHLTFVTFLAVGWAHGVLNGLRSNIHTPYTVEFMPIASRGIALTVKFAMFPLMYIGHAGGEYTHETSVSENFRKPRFAREIFLSIRRTTDQTLLGFLKF